MLATVCIALSNLVLLQYDYMVFSGAWTSYFLSSSKVHYYVLLVAYFLSVTFPEYQPNNFGNLKLIEKKKKLLHYLENIISILTKVPRKTKTHSLLWLTSFPL